MKSLSFLTNSVFWKAYRRNLIAGIALLLIGLFSFNLLSGNNPLKRGPESLIAAENVGPGFCEDGWTFNGGDAGVHANWTYTGCGQSNGSSSGSNNSNSGSWEYKYPECDWSSNKVYDVYQHTGTGEYDRRNYKYQDGSCGYYKSNSNSNNSNSGSTSSSNSNTQSGSWQFVYPECDWNSKQVYDVYWHSGTGQYDRRNPHYQEDACGYNKEWEGAGCSGNRSVWGVWSKQGGQLLRTERDYGVVPGECNNPRHTPTPYPTQVPQRTYQDRQECDGKTLVVRRYWSDNSKEIVTNYGQYPGYCGVQSYTAPTQTAPVYTNPPQTTPTYTAPTIAYPQTAVPQIQAVCRANAQQIFRGGSITYTAYVSTGGSGRVGRVDFRGEQSQSGPATFTTQYNTTGLKYMMATVYDADTRGGSQVVQCPAVSVDDPSPAAGTIFPTTTTAYPPTYQTTPVYTAPIYTAPTYTNPTPVYQHPAYPAPAPTVVTAQAPVTLAPGVNYCPSSGYQTQISGNIAYCLQYGPAANQQQMIAYTYGPQGIINQQVISTSTISGSNAAPAGTVPATSTQPQYTQPSATVSPVQTTPPTSNVQCPAGYTPQAYGASVYCVATTTAQKTVSNTTQNKEANVVLAGVPAQPQVTTTAASSVTELPRTGLPLAAWGVSALLPLGLKLRKGKKGISDVSINSIWLDRQLKKD